MVNSHSKETIPFKKIWKIFHNNLLLSLLPRVVCMGRFVLYLCTGMEVRPKDLGSMRERRGADFPDRYGFKRVITLDPFGTEVAP